MRVLGIDPGVAITGYAVLEDGSGRVEVLEAGVIRTPAQEALPRRLRTIFTEVGRLVEEYHPDALAVEEVFFNQNVTTAMSVSQARGVVLLAGSEIEQVESYTPLEVKRQICGYGRAKKPQVQSMVRRLLRMRELPKPDDAADALAVALCHLLRERSGLRAYAPPKGKGRR
jgi:crossover junction endodeoxyribonuclease RuvC